MAQVIIIGAGLTGLSAGFHARIRGLDYQIFEKESRVGGLCRTIKKDGFLLDCSGHLLYFRNPYCRRLVKNLLGPDLSSHKRSAFIYTHGVFVPYPFQVNLHRLPAKVIEECLLGFVRAYYENEDLPSSSYRTFHDWIMAKLGKGIGKHFMFPYNTKSWTVPPKDLTCDWLARYVPRPSLEDVFSGSFSESKKDFGYNSCFYYPRKKGIQALSDALAERTPGYVLNEELIGVHLQDRRVEFASGRKVEYEKLISTVPLKMLVRILKGRVPSEVTRAAEKLKHTSLLVVNLAVRGEEATSRHWVYLPEVKYQAYRIGCYSNISKDLAPAGTRSYYVEISYRRDRPLNREQVVQRTIDDLCDMGFVGRKRDVLFSDVVDVECAYVIYDRNHSRARRTILTYLERNGIFSIGRYGGWEYSGMEEAIEHGRRTINLIKEGR